MLPVVKIENKKILHMVNHIHKRRKEADRFKNKSHKFIIQIVVLGGQNYKPSHTIAIF